MTQNEQDWALIEEVLEDAVRFSVADSGAALAALARRKADHEALETAVVRWMNAMGQIEAVNELFLMGEEIAARGQA